MAVRVSTISGMSCNCLFTLLRNYLHNQWYSHICLIRFSQWDAIWRRLQENDQEQTHAHQEWWNQDPCLMRFHGYNVLVCVFVGRLVAFQRASDETLNWVIDSNLSGKYWWHFLMLLAGWLRQKQSAQRREISVQNWGMCCNLRWFLWHECSSETMPLTCSNRAGNW